MHDTADVLSSSSKTSCVLRYYLTLVAERCSLKLIIAFKPLRTILHKHSICLADDKQPICSADEIAKLDLLCRQAQT